MLPRRVAACLPIGTLVGAIVVGALALAVRGRRALGIDRRVDDRFIHVGANAHRLADLLRDIGNPFPFACLLTAALIAWAVCTGWGPAIAVGCGVGLDLILIEYVLKPLIGRNPPYGHGDTFPSGHTGASFGLATMLMLLAAQPAISRRLGPVIRLLMGIVLFAVATGVGLAMVVTRAHYFTDVLAGIPIGILMPLLGAAFYDWLVRRRRSPARPRHDTSTNQPVISPAVNAAPR